MFLWYGKMLSFSPRLPSQVSSFPKPFMSLLCYLRKMLQSSIKSVLEWTQGSRTLLHPPPTPRHRNLTGMAENRHDTAKSGVRRCWEANFLVPLSQERTRQEGTLFPTGTSSLNDLWKSATGYTLENMKELAMVLKTEQDERKGQRWTEIYLKSLSNIFLWSKLFNFP